MLFCLGHSLRIWNIREVIEPSRVIKRLVDRNFDCVHYAPEGWRDLLRPLSDPESRLKQQGFDCYGNPSN
jgi:hypothetical protein